MQAKTRICTHNMAKKLTVFLGISVMLQTLVYSESCTYGDLTGSCLPSDTDSCGYFITNICTTPNTVSYTQKYFSEYIDN